MEAMRARACVGKRIYSPSVARLVAQRMRRKGEQVSPYRCNFCGQWHIGHVMSMEGVRALARIIVERRA